MRSLTVIALLLAGCGHGGADAANAFGALVTLAEAPAQVAALAHGVADCAEHPHHLCNPTRPDLEPYLRGTVVVSGPLGPAPVAFTEVTLERDGVAVRAAATDRRGVFSFSCGLAPGSYDLVLRTDYHGGLRLFIDGPRRDLLLVAARQ